MLAQIKHYRGNHKITPGRPLCWSSCGSETFHSSLRLWTHNPKTRCCLPDFRSFCRDSDLITINYTSNQTNLSAINKIPRYCIFLKPNCNEAFVSWQLKMVLIEFLRFVHGYLSVVMLLCLHDASGQSNALLSARLFLILANMHIYLFSISHVPQACAF